jgi:transposase
MDGEGFEGVKSGVLDGHLEVRSGGRVEVIRGVRRRRRWSRSEKAEITRESFMPGASVSDVARRHGMSLGLLHHWRRALRSSAGDALQTFVPILPAEEAEPVSSGRSSEGVIEIDVCDASIRLRGAVDGGALRTVLAAVRRE